MTIWFIARMRRGRKPKKEKVDEHTRQERAVWAWANILSSNQGTLSSFGVARVEMQLEVHLPGNPVYPAKVTWLVDKDSLPKNVEQTHLSLFDGSNCGIALKDKPVFSVQYHPEASPGPRDSHYLFMRFVEMMRRAKRKIA